MQPKRSHNSLADLARSTQQNRDAALLRATTELFVHDLSHDSQEIHRYEELATHFLPKVSAADRTFVSERLATCPDAPAAVVRLLARDVLDAAAPVIRNSSALTGLDLLAVIAATGVEHHRLIARRTDLTDPVKRALRLTADAEVMACLQDQSTAPDAPQQREGEPPAEGPPADGPPSEPYRPAASVANDWHSPDRFLRHDRKARLRILADLATRPPVRRNTGSANRLDRAFRAILGAAKIVGYARTGQQGPLISAIAEGLALDTGFVAAGLADATGEPLAIMLKALRLDDVQAQQVFLLASPAGRDTATFFPLADLYAGMESEVAEVLCDAWRTANQGQRGEHQPYLADDSGHRRSGVAQPAARPSTLPAEQAKRA